jgi:hypothetical protein
LSNNAFRKYSIEIFYGNRRREGDWEKFGMEEIKEGVFKRYTYKCLDASILKHR